jgi:hypothetical protein
MDGIADTLSSLPSGMTASSSSGGTNTTKPVIMSVLLELQKYATLSQQGHDEFKNCQWQITKSRQKVSGVVMTENISIQATLVREELRARFRLFQRKQQPQQVHNMTTSNSNETNDNEDDGPGELLDETANTRVDQSASSDASAKPTATSDAGDDGTTTSTLWELKDVVEHRREEYMKQQSKEGGETSSSKEGESSPPVGLRQRKKTTTTTTTTTPAKTTLPSSSSDDEASWTIVHEDDVVDINSNSSYLYVDEEEKRLFQKDALELFDGAGGGVSSLKSCRDLKTAQSKARQALDYYIHAAHHAATILKLLQQQQQQPHQG